MAPPVLLALGGAEGVWDDLAAARELAGDCHIAGVNEAAAAFAGKLEFMASLHPEKVEVWKRRRKQLGGNLNFLVVCPKGVNGFAPDCIVQELWSGSSGLYLAQVAVRLFGYRKVICCGMPLDENKHHFFDDKPWSAARQYQRGWKEAVEDPTMRGRIRSMSGWTRSLLEMPDRSWLLDLK